MNATNQCSAACEAQVRCLTCGLIKKPIGRDSRDNGLCDEDCSGYRQAPAPGHLWPGELARIREMEAKTNG